MRGSVMLFLLTGDVQIGKTRWLEGLVEQLEKAGVPVAGVLAPGVWHTQRTGGFEKLGIDNLLLPERRVVPFARRRDLAQAEGTYDAESQAAAAGLVWHIFDEAIAEVDGHFGRLAQEAAHVRGRTPGLLVVDELGRLELLCGGGLQQAVAMLDAGPTQVYPHAVLIVRDILCDRAEARFAGAWGTVQRIAPGDAARDAILTACGLPVHPE